MTNSIKPRGLFGPSAKCPGQIPPLGGFVRGQGEVSRPAHTPTWSQVRSRPGEALAGVGAQGPAPSRTFTLPSLLL